MDQILVVIPTEGAGVMVLLFPEVRVCVVGKCVMSSIQGKLELLVWESLYCFCPDSWHIRWKGSNHVALPWETLELGQSCMVIFFCHTSLCCHSQCLPRERWVLLHGVTDSVCWTELLPLYQFLRLKTFLSYPPDTGVRGCEKLTLLRDLELLVEDYRDGRLRPPLSFGR